MLVFCSATRYTFLMGTPKRQSLGKFIRENIIPPGMTISAAAKHLGVGRPALSNLLNGSASLSRQMAVRLEKAFGADSQRLLELQSGAEKGEQQTVRNHLAVRAYVPNFLSIKAKQIHDWPKGNLEPRNQLPVLLRRLIHSTGHGLRQVDFPGYDNAQRKGWDGRIEADAATVWIPAGKSGWEFGTDEDPRTKAEKDYKARIESISAVEQADCTFVFVTPRNWPGKDDWVRKKSQAKDWKAVRAFDASDLEQWLEESIPAQMWLAEKLGMPVTGFETLEHCWDRWAAASKPAMTAEIFSPSIAAYRDKLKSWLNMPSDRVFVVAADSRDEALAFLSCLFREPEIAAQAGDLAVVFESAQSLRSLTSSSSPFIPIATTQEAERELASFHPRFHCIAIRPRNAVDSKPDIALDILAHDAFEKALAAMGLTGDDVVRLERASGSSPTILRRPLAEIDAIRTPGWACDPHIGRSLIPMTLVGTWHAKSTADRQVLSALGVSEYDKIENSLIELLQQDDAPVWSIGQYRGVASKIDALFGISKWITQLDLERFFKVAADVLSESDPALDLPEDQRWAAGLYGKVRNHSAALREGVCETLVILSVHGSHLFQQRLGFNAEAQVSILIRRLLTPLSLEKLLSHDDDLPRYAEAAPDEFLSLLEADLQKSEPVVLGLLRPASTGVLGGCPRSGLLWALECLAWKHLGRVSSVLAQLSRTSIEDNWANKPIASLKAIYRSWMPQTAASLEERIKSLETLVRRFPMISWEICIDELDRHSRIGHHSYRPRWRSDASGAGQVKLTAEVVHFRRKVLDLALAWFDHNEKTLADLVERIEGIPEEDQAKVWGLIDAWSETVESEVPKAELRERIRRFAFTRRAQRRGVKVGMRERARATYAKLRPLDPVMRHGWLFAKQWVEESADEVADDQLDYEKRDQRVHTLRTDALKEIWDARGFEGISQLLSDSEAAQTIGRYAALCMTREHESPEFIRRCLATEPERHRVIDGCVEGFFASMEGTACATIVADVLKDATAAQIVRLFRCLPFTQENWRLLDRYGEEIRKRYWQEVVPSWSRHTDAEMMELIDKLLEVKRPRAAFFAVRINCDRVETSSLKRLLQAIPTEGEEAEGTYQLDSHHIAKALTSLHGRTGVTSDELAQLEFLYLEALEHSDHGIPNLERQISESPGLFAQAVALTYKRTDDGQDPPEWRIEDPERRSAVASTTHSLLDRIKRIPGTADDGTINTEALMQWLMEVRRLCAQLGRAETGDECIGELLSRGPADKDGIHPCLAICEAMETIASPRIGQGFAIGVYNARGAHFRVAGGEQERQLAAQYRAWGIRRALEYPYVGSVLERIAVSYDRDAEWHDSDAQVQKRLNR